MVDHHFGGNTLGVWTQSSCSTSSFWHSLIQFIRGSSFANLTASPLHTNASPEAARTGSDLHNDWLLGLHSFCCGIFFSRWVSSYSFSICWDPLVTGPSGLCSEPYISRSKLALAHTGCLSLLLPPHRVGLCGHTHIKTVYYRGCAAHETMVGGSDNALTSLCTSCLCVPLNSCMYYRFPHSLSLG